MTIYQKSVAGWIAGGVIGLVVGPMIAARTGKPRSSIAAGALGAIGGAMLVGSINDVRLERKRDENLRRLASEIARFSYADASLTTTHDPGTRGS